MSDNAHCKKHFINYCPELSKVCPYCRIAELEATIKRVERLLPFTSLCCQTVVRYAAIKRALGEST